MRVRAVGWQEGACQPPQAWDRKEESQTGLGPRTEHESLPLQSRGEDRGYAQRGTEGIRTQVSEALRPDCGPTAASACLV